MLLFKLMFAIETRRRKILMALNLCGFLAFWQDFILVLLAIVFSKIRCARFWRAAKATRYFYFFDNVRYNILLPPRPSPTSFAT
jgi:hypothetical protein